MSWRDDAACRKLKLGVDLFFPERGDGERIQSEAAKNFCKASCHVREECLAANLREKFGIVGGTDPHERMQIRRGLRQETAIDA